MEFETLDRTILIKSDHALVPLYGGKFAKIDIESIPLVQSYRWYLSTHGYANGRRVGTSSNGFTPMHRIINNTPMGYETDHKNCNKLDNTITNLRTVTKAQNNQNRVAHRGSSSKYKGVSWDKDSRKWRASIVVNRNTKYLGLYIIEEAAARIYDSYALSYFGEYSRLNFTEEMGL